jgi:hypothetical protein
LFFAYANVASQGFDNLIEALVFREYEEEQVAGLSFDLDASALSTFPALVSSSASFTALSSDSCDVSFAFQCCSKALIDDSHGMFLLSSEKFTANHLRSLRII